MKALREDGHSLRSIAEVAGVSKSCIEKDVAHLASSGHLTEPEHTNGRDGKTYRKEVAA